MSAMGKRTETKQRVAEYGEVFTSEKIVNDMLDLVKQETERIESRFLEPACGTGNFLTEILRRKLTVVEKKYRRSQFDFERYLVLAVSSIYGIDILEDNVIECRERLFRMADERYTLVFKRRTKDEVRTTLRYILSKNIVWGDALTMTTAGPEPRQIIFSEWSFPFNDSRIKRRDFVFAEIMPNDPTTTRRPDLFSKPDLVSDLGEKVFVPTETRSYPLIHFLKVGEEYE